MDSDVGQVNQLSRHSRIFSQNPTPPLLIVLNASDKKTAGFQSRINRPEELVDPTGIVDFLQNTDCIPIGRQSLQRFPANAPDQSNATRIGRKMSQKKIFELRIRLLPSPKKLLIIRFK